MMRVSMRLESVWQPVRGQRLNLLTWWKTVFPQPGTQHADVDQQRSASSYSPTQPEPSQLHRQGEDQPLMCRYTFRENDWTRSLRPLQKKTQKPYFWQSVIESLSFLENVLFLSFTSAHRRKLHRTGNHLNQITFICTQKSFIMYEDVHFCWFSSLDFTFLLM